MWIVFLCPTGEITLLEFMEGAQKDEWVMDLLKLDVNAGSFRTAADWNQPHDVFGGRQSGAIYIPEL